MFALMLLTVADVFMRYVFNSPIRGSFELTEMMIPLMVFLGCAHTHDNGDHVVIDVIYEKLPRAPKWIVSIISQLIYLAVMSLMCWRYYIHSGNLRATNAWSSQLEIPHWPILLLGAVATLGYVASLLLDMGAIIFKKEVLGNDSR